MGNCKGKEASDKTGRTASDYESSRLLPFEFSLEVVWKGELRSLRNFVRIDGGNFKPQCDDGAKGGGLGFKPG